MDTTIQVDGARELRRIARKVAGPESKALIANEHKSIAARVARKAEQRAPKRTRRLARTIRGLGTQTKASVSAGRGSVNDYAGRVHYGDPYGPIAANEFITDTVSDEFADIYSDFEEAYERLAKTLATT